MEKTTKPLLFNTSLTSWGLSKPDWATIEGVSLSDQKIILIDQSYRTYHEVITKYNLYQRRAKMFTYCIVKCLFAIGGNFILFSDINLLGLVQNYPIWKFTRFGIPTISLAFLFVLTMLSIIVSGKYTARERDLEPKALKAKEKLLNDLKEILK